jgi:chromosome segregation ATPase
MSELRGLSNVNELSEQRLWKTLDSISERLTGIERQLGEVVRLEERVNNHEQALARYGNRLDSHDRRLHDTELWQASYGDKNSVERLVTNVQEEVHDLKKKVDELESSKDIIRGQRDIGKEVLKWLAGIFAAIIIYMATKG